MQTYKLAEDASHPWPNEVLVEAREANLAVEGYFDAVLDDLRPLIHHYTSGFDSEATRSLLTEHLPEGPVAGVKASIIDDILRLGSLFESTLSSGAMKLQLEIINHDMCRLFHHDFYRQRLLCTLKVPGTEWLDHVNVNRAALGKGSNDAIVKDAEQIRRARTNDVVLLKGARFGGGVLSDVHRSPPIAHQNITRVVLKLDE